MNKTTLATIKSFIKRELKNNNFYIKTKSSFNGMIDVVEEVKDNFTKCDKKNLDLTNKYTLGLTGIWFVGQSGNSFENYTDDNFIGYKIYNCCGSFIIAMKKLY